jgi:hypothetical protein
VAKAFEYLGWSIQLVQVAALFAVAAVLIMYGGFATTTVLQNRLEQLIPIWVAFVHQPRTNATQIATADL